MRIDNAAIRRRCQLKKYNRQGRQRLVKRRTGEVRTVWAAIRRRCQFKRYNRQCKQQEVTRNTAPVVPRGLQKASVVNSKDIIDNASSKRSREAPQNVVPRGLRKASVVNFRKNFPLFYFCNLLINEQLQPTPHPYE